MQTVDLKLNVPVGYGVDEFIAKIRSYAEHLEKKRQEKEEGCDYEPNEETIEAMHEAQEHMAAYKRGEKWATQGAVDTSSVEAMLKSCGL